MVELLGDNVNKSLFFLDDNEHILTFFFLAGFNYIMSFRCIVMGEIF